MAAGASRSDAFTPASGQGAVAIGGDAREMIIVTGNGNTISLTRQGTFAFHLLDDNFRQSQRKRAPAAFYDGTRPNWANIAQKDDAPRNLYQDLRQFATATDLPAQRIGIILGLAGEGKTTLLMRLVWDLAEAGYPVLWRHSGTVFSHCQMPLSGERPLILCFDQADTEEELPQLLNDLHDIGLPFVVLCSARLHEWRAAGLEGRLRAVAHFQPFRLGLMDRQEVEDLLSKLEEVDKLDRLADLRPEERVRHFLDRQKAAGQLLPALLTARYGMADFSHFVLSVLERVRQWPDGEFLLRGHALISAVHRFGFWLGRDLLAEALGKRPEDLHTLLGRLEGELLEVTEADQQRLYTRHPVIAEEAFRQATGHRMVPEAKFLYQTLFRALGDYLQAHLRDPQRKLCTLLPLALKRRGEYEEARSLFRLAAEADPTHAATWQAWALMERESGNTEEARRLFRQGVQADPTSAPTWQAWALMERELGEYERARELFAQGTQADPTHAPTWQAWALMEKGLGKTEEARRLFRQGVQADPTSAPTWQAWALMEKGLEEYDRARELFAQGTKADPTSAPTWQAWALMERELGEYERARELFAQGTQADPTHAPTWQAWALMEKELGNTEEARRLFRQGVQADPTSAPTYQAWALMEKGLGKTEEARRLFRQGVQADPTHAPVYQAWALMEKGLGEYERARELFEQGTKADPTSAPTWQAWALMEKELGKTEAARRLFRQGVQADPTSAATYQAWALMEAQQVDPRRALELLDEGLSRAREPRGRALLLSTRGGTLARLKRFSEAEEAFHQALALDEANPLTHYHYAMDVLAPQGRREEACRHLRRALQLRPHRARDRRRIEEALRQLGCEGPSPAARG